MTIEIPWNRLIENSHDWNLVGNTMTAGQTSAMSVDIRSDGGGFWRATLSNIRFKDRSDTLLWRAIRNIANGGIVPIVVYRRDATWAPFPGTTEGEITSHSDGTYFDDGTGYYEATIDVTCNGGAALRATTMVLNLNVCAALQGGECFSINHATFGWRLYEIGTAIENDDGTTTITFNPPLREAITDGEQLEFDRPRCTMKLANSSAMDFSNQTYPFSLASVTFVETKYAT
jgi:hypothetical protein